MRDPLAWIPVRYKLPLTFAFFCLLAFGFGGYVVTTTARESLTRQIGLRLNDRATSLNMVVDKSLELLDRRVADFASDGYIRLQFERLVSDRFTADADETAAVHDELVRHLRENKLPLVEPFIDAFLLDTDGRPILSAYAGLDAAPRASYRIAPHRHPPVSTRDVVFTCCLRPATNPDVSAEITARHADLLRASCRSDRLS